jgi:AcrR family transcriptional regulator
VTGEARGKLFTVGTPALPSLRERTRRAVQAELVDVAKRLFVEQGYEHTTVDAIAAAAGMSKRSFFRYFGSKEELILGKYDLMGEQLIARLAERPDEEPVWTSLRRMFDDVVTYTADQANTAGADEMERIVSTSPVLHAAYLQRLHRMQSDIADVVRQRALRAGHPFHADDPSPSAIVGAAFAAVAAARDVSVAHGRPFDAAVDAAMRAIAGVGTR